MVTGIVGWVWSSRSPHRLLYPDIFRCKMSENVGKGRRVSELKVSESVGKCRKMFENVRCCKMFLNVIDVKQGSQDPEKLKKIIADLGYLR